MWSLSIALALLGPDWGITGEKIRFGWCPQGEKCYVDDRMAMGEDIFNPACTWYPWIDLAISRAFDLDNDGDFDLKDYSLWLVSGAAR